MLTGNALTERVIGLAIDVHRELGPGLLESVYEECLCCELAESALAFKRQVTVPVVYRGRSLEAGFRADIVVAQELILEIKSVETLMPKHEAQLLTYLRLSKYRIGLLMNFNVLRLIDGLRRCIM
jgi:GxxExxY protein